MPALELECGGVIARFLLGWGVTIDADPNGGLGREAGGVRGMGAVAPTAAATVTGGGCS